MSAVKPRDDATTPYGIRDLTEALGGAFAEGIDLGPRGEHIRQLGRSLEATIEALRIELSGLGTQAQIDGMLLDLDQLTRMARAACAYGIGKRA